MFFKKENKQKRKGMNLYAIIGGIALAAILGLVVAPRLSSAQLPGFKSNLVSDVNSMQQLLDSYASNHQGSYAGLFSGTLSDGSTAVNGSGFDVLLDEKIMDLSMGKYVSSGAAGVYAPSWADGDLSIKLNTVTASPSSQVNIYVNLNVVGVNGALAGFKKELEIYAIGVAEKKYGHVNGDATATSKVAITTHVADTLVDGLFEYTVK
ncbi:MAG: hypothetical protein DRG78_02390 [Epsilonproteobacteria bacterium]|nr:MAG: hypothetical protein DRG78_02390 [Campylobacterota bacterium]